MQSLPVVPARVAPGKAHEGPDQWQQEALPSRLVVLKRECCAGTHPHLMDACFSGFLSMYS